MLSFHRGDKVHVKSNWGDKGQRVGVIRFTIPKHLTSLKTPLLHKQYIEERKYWVEFPNGTMRSFYPQRIELIS